MGTGMLFQGEYDTEGDEEQQSRRLEAAWNEARAADTTGRRSNRCCWGGDFWAKSEAAASDDIKNSHRLLISMRKSL